MKKHYFTRLILFLFISCSVSLTAASAQNIFGGIKLLDGYKYKTGKAVDAVAGTIYKPNGLIITFEAGFSQGYAADKKIRSNMNGTKSKLSTDVKSELPLSKQT